MARRARGFVRLHLYLAPDELQYLRLYAKRKGVPMTDVCRQALLRELRTDIERGSR